MKPFSILLQPLRRKIKTAVQKIMIAKTDTRVSDLTAAIGIVTEMDHEIVTETGSDVSAAGSADETKRETKK